ncbi:hypothetical protein GYMLUDRAFT_118872, partial [Collybiopsis luxurians FD-317 M1]
TNGSCDHICQRCTLFQTARSCVTVLIPCPWVAVHPNVSLPRDGFWRVLGTKIGLMVITLLAAKLMVLWAARQWFSARELAERHRNNGWRISHGFLFLMGGFGRYKGE